MLLEKDKCELCALRVTYDQDTIEENPEKVENFVSVLRELQHENIVEAGYTRRVCVSSTGKEDKTVMCAVNSDNFLPKNKNKPCPNFILNMGLSTSEALALNTAKRTDRLTSEVHKMTLVILALTFFAVVTTFFL